MWHKAPPRGRTNYGLPPPRPRAVRAEPRAVRVSALDEAEPSQEPHREPPREIVEGEPSYLQPKGLARQASARWASLLEEDTELLDLIRSGRMSGVRDGARWRDAMERQQEKRLQAMAREEQLKAAAEAKESPQPTSTPKPVRWRKLTFGLTPTENIKANEAHNMWGELLDE